MYSKVRLPEEKRVWVIDDDPAFRYLSLILIRTSGAPFKELREFGLAADAFDFLLQGIDGRENLPDIIMLDLNMPRMDGWQFLEKFSTVKSRLSQPIAIYIVSSSSDSVEVNKAKNHPCVADYLVKPYTPEKFAEIMAAKWTIVAGRPKYGEMIP